jgi:hypothetical protein
MVHHTSNTPRPPETERTDGIAVKENGTLDGFVDTAFWSPFPAALAVSDIAYPSNPSLYKINIGMEVIIVH